MSTATCLTDTKDLALNPATTVEDTQHAQESIFSYTNSLLLMFSLTICPPFSSISHAYLLPFHHLCLICFLSQPSLLTEMQSLSGSFYPKHFLYPYLLIYTSALFRVSLNHSRCPRLSPSVFHFLSFAPHSLPHPSPSLSPANSFIVLGSGWTMSAHMGPCAVPAAKAGSTREHP